MLTNPTGTLLGHSGGALEFNGTTSRAELPESAVTHLRFTTAFTITAWVNPTTLGAEWHMIAVRELGAQALTTAGRWEPTTRRCGSSR